MLCGLLWFGVVSSFAWRQASDPVHTLMEDLAREPNRCGGRLRGGFRSGFRGGFRGCLCEMLMVVDYVLCARYYQDVHETSRSVI